MHSYWALVTQGTQNSHENLTGAAFNMLFDGLWAAL